MSTFLEPQNTPLYSITHCCLLKLKYSSFYKIDEEQIAHQIDAVHDEIWEMYAIDEDVIPCDDDGNHLTTAEIQYDDASSHHSEPSALDESSVTLEGSDSTEDSAEFLTPAIQNNLSGVPRKIRNLMSFFNPNPEK
jgi:hypothetical protein